MDLTCLNSSINTGIVFLILPLGPQSLKYLILELLRKRLLTPGVGDRQHDENVMFLQSRESECHVVDKIGVHGNCEPRGEKQMTPARVRGSLPHLE